jgi:5-methylcytosine-specific restriction endonuclease McrA
MSQAEKKRLYNKKWAANNRAYHNEYMKEWRAKNPRERRPRLVVSKEQKAENKRIWMKKYKLARQTWKPHWLVAHGPCPCGSKRNLHIDHINPKDKKIKVQQLWAVSEKKRQAELKKCQVLCKKCHLKKTIGENQRFTFEQQKEIRRRKACGETYKSLAKELGCNPSTLQKIVSGKTWAEFSPTKAT